MINSNKLGLDDYLIDASNLRKRSRDKYHSTWDDDAKTEDASEM